MRRPKLLDLYCCEGGAAMGYHRAGFDVYGVDKDNQRRYPFAFHLGDALVVVRRLLLGEAVPFTHRDGTVEWLTLADFTIIHASPPCQAYSITKHSHTVEHPDLLAPTRGLLIKAGIPYIIENVIGAPMIDPLLLCGTMFGLRATDMDGQELALWRHRLFETSFPIGLAPSPCAHDHTMVGGVYGGGPMQRNKNDKRGGYTPKSSVRAELMGIDWATQHGLSQAIPPAYTEWLGMQALEALEVAA